MAVWLDHDDEGLGGIRLGRRPNCITERDFASRAIPQPPQRT